MAINFTLSLTIAAVAYMIHIYKKFFHHRGTAVKAVVNMNASTVSTDLLEAIDEDVLQEFVKTTDDQMLFSHIKNRATNCINNVEEDPIEVLKIDKLISIKKLELAERTQQAAVGVSEEVLRLQNRLEPLQEFCKQAYGEIQKATRLAPKHKIMKVQRDCKVLKDFILNLEKVGNGRYVYLFHFVPCGDAKEDEQRMATFDALYDEVEGNVAFKHILLKTEFDFEKFESFKTPIEDARSRLTEAQKKQIIASNSYSSFLNACQSDGNIVLIRESAKEYKAIISANQLNVDN